MIVTLLDFKFEIAEALKELGGSGVAEGLIRTDGVIGVLPGEPTDG